MALSLADCILTYGSNTDGCDPDSSWNVYIASNSFSTGDDCIAIKAGTVLASLSLFFFSYTNVVYNSKAIHAHTRARARTHTHTTVDFTHLL